MWRDDRTLIGASDAGAHIDMVDAFSYATMVLQQGVREHGVVSLEEAIYQMTDRPARYMGLIDRGRIEPGYHADIVIFDAESVGRGPTYFRHDVPGDQFRHGADARGVDQGVFVNGVQIVKNGVYTWRAARHGAAFGQGHPHGCNRCVAGRADGGVGRLTSAMTGRRDISTRVALAIGTLLFILGVLRYAFGSG